MPSLDRTPLNMNDECIMATISINIEVKDTKTMRKPVLAKRYEDFYY